MTLIFKYNNRTDILKSFELDTLCIKWKSLLVAEICKLFRNIVARSTSPFATYVKQSSKAKPKL